MKAKKKAAKKVVVKKAVEKFRKEVSATQGGPALRVVDGLKKVKTVAEMMKEAKTYGIKNFRVLNRAELSEAIEIVETDKEFQGQPMENPRMKEIVKGAVSRWKSGWGSEKVAAK